MGRGRSMYLSYTALVLLSATSSTNAYNLWKVSIWEGPAPSPKDGPPFSAHASRNLALLPYQIVGIVGAYIGTVLIVGTLLLTVGRRLRKQAQELAMQPSEMVKPMTKAFDPSPISPQNSWYSPRKLRNKKSTTSSVRSGTSNQLSPGMDSVVSFDNTVVEADRQRRHEEMERLYAAVMAQDARKASQPNVTELPPTTAPPEYAGRVPPRLITDAPGLRHLQIPVSGPVSPGTPRSPIRAIYPPGSSIPYGPQSPTSPIKAEYPNYSLRREASSESVPRVTREHRTPSFGSAQTPTTTSGTAKKMRKSLRNIKISAPLMKDDNSDGARTPLSPRFYTDPGVPPEPPTARTTESVDSQGYGPPTTPGTTKSWNEEEIDQIRDLPQANPQRISTYQYDNPAQQVTNAASTRPDPTKSGSLPLREMNRQYAQQQQAAAAAASTSPFPLSPGRWNANLPPSSAGGFTSAGPVKTTFLEARKDKLGFGPRTGQATPYSPYMPFTPLTPVAPHLTTRVERKQRQKEEKKVRGVITEEEAVVDEKELWSSGY